MSRLASDPNQLPGEACGVNDAIEDLAELNFDHGFPTEPGTRASRNGYGGEVARDISAEKNESERRHSGVAR
jgi:hypothetical protein